MASKLWYYQWLLYFFNVLSLSQAVAIANGMADAITLSCHSSYMLVDVDLKFFTSKLDPLSLHLQHHECGPYSYDDDKASFRVPLYGCGTGRLVHDKLLIYSNAVRNSDKRNSTVEISRVPIIRLPFGCSYQHQYSFVVAAGGGAEKTNAFKRKKPVAKIPSYPRDSVERPFILPANRSLQVSSVSYLLCVAVAVVLVIMSS